MLGYLNHMTLHGDDIKLIYFQTYDLDFFAKYKT
jgi:hypothetical protein